MEQPSIMSARRKKPKRDVKKKRGHQPRGIKILHDDRDILVVDKTSGLLTMSNEKERDRTAYSFLNDYVRKGVEKSNKRVFIVHRLDRETSGVLVFAKHEEAKHFLQDNWGDFQKTYYAVVHGKMSKPEGVIESYLAESGVHRVYATPDSKKGKLSKTGYKVIQEKENFSLLEINLLTGRKHQIRVHLSDAGCPVVGDKKYGTFAAIDKGLSIKRLYLHAASLTIAHPHTKVQMSFSTGIPAGFESLVQRQL
ncbi:MAG: RluA family pseudouridine synthase [Verrucomicrobiales bacterium]|jgi:RluA family pseudouridine synthase